MISRLAICLASLALFACAGTTPAPLPCNHARSDFVEVDYPPPGAMVEVIPPRPTASAVWIDGHWIWRGRYWVWKRGGWVDPAHGLRFARSELVYRKNGRLMYAECSWRDAEGRPVKAPPFLVPAAVPPTEETAE